VSVFPHAFRCRCLLSVIHLFIVAHTLVSNYAYSIYKSCRNGVNIATLARVEHNNEVHHLSLLELRTKLIQVHAGRCDSIVFNDTDRIVAITEVDVDQQRH
jgi:hypothetical protein